MIGERRKFFPGSPGAKIFARAEKLHILIRKLPLLHKKKTSPGDRVFAKKYRKMLFASFSSLYHCVLCQSVVLPSCFLQRLQGCKSKIFSALRAPGLQKQNFLSAARAKVAKVKFSPRCARQIPEKTSDLV